MKRILIILAALALAACSAKEAPGPVLNIEGGRVQGVASDLKGVTVFKGIPFAAPPVGENRWRAPQPVVPWEGVRICDRFGHPPYQNVHYPGGYTTEWGYGDESPYSEDCLYLNVYTKAPGKVDRKMPVAFWIFGGGLREGWGSEPEFAGEEFAAKDVVLVTFNYRVGPFGFFAHPEISAEDPEHATGNFGLLDQIQALKWVKNNIAQFGGDPDNIMIFGQSAGSRSVKNLCASPLSRGMFSKAVIMSGNGLVTDPTSFYAQMPDLNEVEQEIKKITDWANLTDLKKMRAASTETIYSLGTICAAVTGERNRLAGGPVSAYIDGYTMTKTFDQAALDGTLAEVPYMIGYTLNDAGSMDKSIADFCLNREEKGGKAYAYEFARPLPDDGSRKNVLKGAFHSSDLWYVFKSLKNCWRPWTKGDWDLSEYMQTCWVNFAKYGDPNGPDGGEWTPYTSDKPEFMLFKLNDAEEEDSSMGEPIKPAPMRRPE